MNRLLRASLVLLAAAACTDRAGPASVAGPPPADSDTTAPSPGAELRLALRNRDVARARALVSSMAEHGEDAGWRHWGDHVIQLMGAEHSLAGSPPAAHLPLEAMMSSDVARIRSVGRVAAETRGLVLHELNGGMQVAFAGMSNDPNVATFVSAAVDECLERLRQLSIKPRENDVLLVIAWDWAEARRLVEEMGVETDEFLSYDVRGVCVSSTIVEGCSEVAVVVWLEVGLRDSIRHEVAHGVLGSTCAGIEPWLEEGLAIWCEWTAESWCLSVDSDSLERVAESVERFVREATRAPGSGSFECDNKEERAATAVVIDCILKSRPEHAAASQPLPERWFRARSPSELAEALRADMKSLEQRASHAARALRSGRRTW